MHSRREIQEESLDAIFLESPLPIKIRAVAGFAEMIERKENLGCGGPIRTE
jgi:hypothetical protein